VIKNVEEIKSMKIELS